MNKELEIITGNRLRITFSNYGTWTSIKFCYPYDNENKEIICFYEGMTLLRKKLFSPVFLIKYKSE